MNKRSQQILLQILAEEGAWDKKTRELRYLEVVGWMNGVREAWYINDVVIPRLIRFNHLLKLLSCIPESEWSWLDYDTGVEGWACNDDQVAWEVSERVDAMNAPIWESQDDGWEHPEKEEIMAFAQEHQLLPNQVPSKTDKFGNTQQSLF